jgi:Skp family chaperone for outer membrane proteins
MKLSHVAVTVLALSFAAALAVQGQDKAPAGGRVGVLNLRDCLDKTKNQWIADIDLELQKQQEADSGRATDLNPQERLRIRTKNLDAGNRRRLEVYTEIVRLSGALAKERGFDIVQRIDRMPVLESGDADLMGQIDRRMIVHFDPAVDLTASVLEQLNKDYAAKKK